MFDVLAQFLTLLPQRQAHCGTASYLHEISSDWLGDEYYSTVYRCIPSCILYMISILHTVATLYSVYYIV